MSRVRMKTFIVNRNTPDLAENQRCQVKLMSERVPWLENEVIVYNCDEEPFQGKLSGHCRALQEHGSGDCDYYWFNHPDLSFAIDMDCLSKLIGVMERNHWIAVISPTEKRKTYASMIKEGYRWHPVATCDYLSLLVRRSVVDRIGFMNAEFKYSWGAIHEYSYKVYREGWCVAYCDAAKMHHFGGTTYGGKGAVQRDVYIKNAKAFARQYFVEHYGKSWDREFARLLPPGVANNYRAHRKHWERGERLATVLSMLNFIKEHALMRAGWGRKPIRVLLGCDGTNRRGWVGIDPDIKLRPHFVADPTDLNMFEDESVDEVECSRRLVPVERGNTGVAEALGEWRRVLKPKGTLSLTCDDALGRELQTGFGGLEWAPCRGVAREGAGLVTLTYRK